MIKFNPEVHFLGKLCKHGHDYEGVGLSVRYKASSRCVTCKRIARVKYLLKNKRSCAARNKKYKARNKEAIRKNDRLYRTKNDRATKRKNSRYALRQTSLLGDAYIKSTLGAQIGIPSSEIPQELIELKREQLTIHRLLKESKNGLTRTRD